MRRVVSLHPTVGDPEPRRRGLPVGPARPGCPTRRGSPGSGGPAGLPTRSPRLCAFGTTVVPTARTTTTGSSSTSVPEGLWSYREAITVRASSSTVRLVVHVRSAFLGPCPRRPRFGAGVPPGAPPPPPPPTWRTGTSRLPTSARTRARLLGIGHVGPDVAGGAADGDDLVSPPGEGLAHRGPEPPRRSHQQDLYHVPLRSSPTTAPSTRRLTAPRGARRGRWRAARAPRRPAG
jgi:hypothetical protein